MPNYPELDKPDSAFGEGLRGSVKYVRSEPKPALPLEVLELLEEEQAESNRRVRRS